MFPANILYGLREQPGFPDNILSGSGECPGFPDNILSVPGEWPGFPDNILTGPGERPGFPDNIECIKWGFSRQANLLIFQHIYTKTKFCHQDENEHCCHNSTRDNK